MPLVRFLRKAPPWATAASAFALAIAVASFAPFGGARGALLQSPGRVELDEVSNYSHVKVTSNGRVRTLWFVRDSGEEVVESRVDLARPDNLLVEYTRYMFLSHVFRPGPKRALIVGLGGGSMVHFLKKHDPEVKVDVVEIDPLIVSIADRYFDVRSGGNVDVQVADGLAYLQRAEETYDVIYMDAFLRPSSGTDRTGVPLHLKTVEFYKQVQQRLNPGGVVVFNLNPHLSIQKDLRVIREAFSNTYEFPLYGGDGFVVVASTAGERLTPTAISAAAARLDQRFKTPYSFRKMAGTLNRR